MGDRKSRRTKFFAENPLCCFCGGLAAATTEDHQPGRVFFKGRVWPEGFVFPACENCNRVSAMSEKVMALLLHGEGTSDDRGKFRDLIASLNREYPDVIPKMLPESANEIRRILKSKGLTKGDGDTFADFPIVKLDQEFWSEHFDMFSRKMFLAFHYACFKEPLSKNGKMWFFQHSNVDAATGKFPDDLLDLAKNIALPVRSKVNLHDQFSIRWDIVPEHKSGLFLAQFHGRFAISGVTTENADAFSDGRKPRSFSPFCWPIE